MRILFVGQSMEARDLASAATCRRSSRSRRIADRANVRIDFHRRHKACAGLQDPDDQGRIFAIRPKF
jgi:hypothetical protein